MKARKIIMDGICFVLIIFWFYEGVYKIAHWQQFEFYITHAPLLGSIGGVLKYVIPFGEVGLAASMLLPKYRMVTLYITIGGLLAYIFWIMSVYSFTSRLFWPYHALWEKPTWMQKMLMSLGLCWIAFVLIILSMPRSLNKRVSLNK